MKIKTIFLSLLLCVSLDAKDIYRSYLVQWEGYSEVVYKCPTGKNTIGIGHNLDAHKQPISSYTKEQIEDFYTSDLASALQSARVGISNFDSQPDDVKRVIVSLIFTVGDKGFMKFAKFRNNVANGEYKKAAEELRNSLWYHQVAKTRAYAAYSTLTSVN